MKSFFTTRNLLIIAGILILGVLIWYFASIVAYILIAAVLSLMGKPLVNLLGKVRIGKWQLPVWFKALFTLVVIWALFFAFFRTFIPLIASEAQDLSTVDVDQVMTELQGPIDGIRVWYDNLNLSDDGFAGIEQFISDKIRSVLDIKVVTNLLGTVAGTLGNILWAFFAISFITFFLLRDDRILVESMVLLLPKEYDAAMRHALASIRHLLGRYFLGILLQMTGIMTLITIGMTIIGVGFRHGIVIGLLAAILNIIPYIGPWIGAALGVILGIATHIHLDFTTELLPLVGYMALVFLIVQIIDNVIFQPVIFSNSVNAHPLEIFIVILMAGSLAGVTGMILAIPAYTVMRVFAKEFFNNFRVVQKLTEKI
ncbi:MAG: AI-2E family transporter [Bacteroidota bacterium]